MVRGWDGTKRKEMVGKQEEESTGREGKERKERERREKEGEGKKEKKEKKEEEGWMCTRTP